MESLTEHPVEVDTGLHFLTDWESVQDRSKTRKAGVVSVVLHVGMIVGLLSLPKSVTAPVTEAIRRQVTPLIAPLTELTQREPNRSKVNKEFNVEASTPRPGLHAPVTPPPAPVTTPAAPVRRMAPPPLAKPAPTPAPAPNLPDAPKVEVAQQTPQAPPVNLPAVAPPPPQIQQQEKPKLAFETPAAASTGPGTGKIAKPGSGVQDAIAAVNRPGASGGVTVGDPEAASPGLSGGINAPPTPGRPRASLELLSNPQGVDFRAYLIQVLAAVKLNWFNVWPQVARMGRQGRVKVQFIIDRKGFVPKLVIPSGSGTDALDKAAISGISASQPFPQFPTGYTSNEVRLELNFVYNMR
jgi:TonB family protein